MQSLSSPTSWDLGPRQYLFEDNSALNKFNQNETKLNRIISGLAGTELDDGAGLNVLGCQADMLETNCNELDVCNNSYSFTQLAFCFITPLGDETGASGWALLAVCRPTATVSPDKSDSINWSRMVA